MDDFAIDEIDILDGDESENLLVHEVFNLPVDEAEKCNGSETSNDVGFEPHEGMEFSSKEAAYDFYNAYGYVLGFSIGVNSGYKNAQGTITSMRLVCSKQGFNKQHKCQLEEPFEVAERPNSGTPEKSVPERRTGCKASFHVRLHEGGNWKVTGFHKDHNHEFVGSTPSKKRHLRSHKTITAKEKADIKLLSEQNVCATQIREYLAAKADGKANLHYGKKDVNNQISKENRSLVGVDVNAMVDYFILRQQGDPEFFFAIEPDEDNFAKNIFWVDGRSRRAYKDLGDVTTFDTTYNTNQYSMPMAPFLGVSPH
ncbi:protein FAR1-RELATED SEQUENCE 5-like [Oryza brachyantha]|uniref:protein FAR1-RELATED SEQUENCE 5-like n=1 Tax=Oryza brachyantha TaxID=4533 RepID=UPI001ADBEF4D|nr:protein FAR1-RELATED SEQUENCE 5-like [Oryza brachyantha]